MKLLSLTRATDHQEIYLNLGSVLYLHASVDGFTVIHLANKDEPLVITETIEEFQKKIVTARVYTL